MATSPATRSRAQTPVHPAEARKPWTHYARAAIVNIGIVILILCGLAILLGTQLIIESAGMPGS